jgi:RND superfamily putative drug exporter
MIFQHLGRVVRWAWPLLLLAWGLMLLGTGWAAPPWETVAQDKEFDLLPENVPSRQADAEYGKGFPDHRLASTIVLVLQRTDNAPGGVERDRKWIEDVLEPGLRQIAEAQGGLLSDPQPVKEADNNDPFAETTPPPPARKASPQSIIARIRTPNRPGSGALLVSEDGKAQLVVVELTTEFLSKANWPVITKVEDLVHQLKAQGKLPPGDDLAVTGSAVIGRDRNVAQLQSAHATELLTVLLVIALLVLIYRAPLLALIPLGTVYLAVQLARNILAILADQGYLDLFQGIEIYITILAYGAGVDYCLFLTARYKEELDRGNAPADAVAKAVSGVGAALVASAATVICGIAMMSFAQFGKFREAGFAIPLSLVLVLLATLTFSPSLLRLAGRWAFWPHRPRQVVAGLNVPPPASRRWFLKTGLLQHVWDDVAAVLLRRPGAVWLGTVALLAPFAVAALLLYNHLSYDLVGSLPNDTPSVAGTRVLQQHFPAGVMGPATVLVVNKDVDFDTPEGRAVVRQVTEALRTQKDQLALADVRSLTSPVGITGIAKQAVKDVDPNIPAEERKAAARRLAEEHYNTSFGERHYTGTRLELILAQSPFAKESIAALDRIEAAVRAALPDALRDKTRVYVAGTTASVRDLANVMAQDRSRIELLVLASVLVILIFLLRQVVVSVYLLLSVLFSYYATLGVAFLVFWLFDPHGFNGIDWKVAIFLFTILVAVGEDYNIFLLTRVHEEQRAHGPVEGIRHALTRTGPIISSCGIIMAGTFASLLGGSLVEMKQLGFALAFGVLLDTFVVRPILVPAFLVLLESGRLPSLHPSGRKTSVPPVGTPPGQPLTPAR